MRNSWHSQQASTRFLRKRDLNELNAGIKPRNETRICVSSLAFYYTPLDVFMETPWLFMCFVSNMEKNRFDVSFTLN